MSSTGPTADQQVPPEATAAAEQELARLDQAQHFQPPAPGLPPLQPRSYQMPMAPPQMGYGEPAPPLPGRGGQFQSLEDLYASWPRIGDGTYKLRVHRTYPKSIGNVPTEGWLGDVEEQISLSEFQDRFGGGRYRITVMGPGRRTDAEGRPMEQSLGHMEMTLQGSPSRTSLPKREEPYAMMGMPGGGAMPGFLGFGGEHKEVQIERMRMEQRDKERLANMAAAQGGNPLAQQTIQEIRLSYEQHAQTMREQNRELLTANQKKDETIRELQQMLVAAKGEAAKAEALQRELSDLRVRSEGDLNSIRQRHETEVTSLRDRYEKDTAGLRDRYESSLRDLTERHRNEISDLHTRHRDEMAKEQGRHLEERQRLSEAHTEKLQMYRDDSDRRVTDLRHQHEREMAGLKDTQAQQIETLKMSLDSRLDMKENTATLQIETLKNRISQLESDLQSAESEADELRRQVNKPLAEQLSDAEAIGTKYLGLSRKGTGEGEFDIKKEIVGLIKAGVEQAPVMAEKLGEMRQRNAEAAVAMQQGQMAQQQMMAQQQQAAAMQQRIAPQQRMAAMRPPQPAGQVAPWAAGGGPSPWAPPVSMPTTGAAIGVPPPPAPLAFRPFSVVQQPGGGGAAQPGQAQAQQQQPAAAPPIGGQQVVLDPTAGAPGAPAAPPPPVPVQPIGGGDPAAPGLRLTDEQVVQALNGLSTAIGMGRDASGAWTVQPSMVASQLASAVGRQNIPALLHLVPPEKIFGIIEQKDHAPWRVIATRDGQQYVREVWTALAAEASRAGG